MRLHDDITSALKHPTTWAGIAGAIASVAASVSGHIQTALLSASGACSVIAIILKSPDTEKLDKEPGDEH